MHASTTLRGWSVRLEQHWFALDSVNDTWVRPLTPQARRAPRRTGAETDLVLSREIAKRFTLEAGGSYFTAGPYLRATGGASDAGVGYVQGTFRW